MYQRKFTRQEVNAHSNWKSQSQHLKECLYCDGLPYRQNDMTDLQGGVKYVGEQDAPVFKRDADGSILVTWQGEPSEPRTINYAKKSSYVPAPWMGV